VILQRYRNADLEATGKSGIGDQGISWDERGTPFEMANPSQIQHSNELCTGKDNSFEEPYTEQTPGTFHMAQITPQSTI
jgi:hypothetical protein